MNGKKINENKKTGQAVAQYNKRVKIKRNMK